MTSHTTYIARFSTGTSRDSEQRMQSRPFAAPDFYAALKIAERLAARFNGTLTAVELAEPVFS